MKPHHQPSRPEKTKRYPSSSSILYQSPTQEIFILDIPRSLELAQQLSTSAPEEASQLLLGQSKHDYDRKSILSCPPLQEPYPRPPEPKSAKARKRVLDRIPVAEREFDERVVKVVEGALGHVRARYTGVWCLERECVEGDDESEAVKGKGKRKRGKENEDEDEDNFLSDSKVTSIPSALTSPPIILSPGINSFPDTRSLRGSIVKNPSPLPTTIRLSSRSSIYIPPKSTFLLTHLSQSPPRTRPTIDLPKFTLLLFDPPWPNSSVRRSAHYTTTPTFPAIQSLVTDLISSHLQHPLADGTSASAAAPAPASGVVGIWTTNSAHSRATVRNAFGDTGLEVFEEWIWVKCTDDGVPVFPLGGVWRRTYEVLVWGRRKREGDEEREGKVKRRVILAVPDVHSRKPALKELVESVVFSENGKCLRYTAMEVFARNLTAGWWSVGDEVWKFNCEEWWRNR